MLSKLPRLPVHVRTFREIEALASMRINMAMSDNEEPTSSAPNWKSFASLVPQAFFDVIARLVPGTVLILVYGVVIDSWDFNLLLDQVREFSFSAWSLGVAGCACLAYIVGVASFGWWWGYCWCWTSLRCGLGLGGYKVVADKLLNRPQMFYEPAFPGVFELNEQFSADRDRLREKDPALGARTTKLKAEIHMSGGAGIVLFVLGLYNAFVGKSELDLEPLWLVVVGLGLLLANRHFTIVYVCSIKCRARTEDLDPQPRV